LGTCPNLRAPTDFAEEPFFLEELFGRNVDVLTPASLSPHLKQQIEAEVRFEKLQ
jgi:predicted nucleotidyltransferase